MGLILCERFFFTAKTFHTWTEIFSIFSIKLLCYHLASQCAFLSATFGNSSLGLDPLIDNVNLEIIVRGRFTHRRELLLYAMMPKNSVSAGQNVTKTSR